MSVTLLVPLFVSSGVLIAGVIVTALHDSVLHVPVSIEPLMRAARAMKTRALLLGETLQQDNINESNDSVIQVFFLDDSREAYGEKVRLGKVD